MRSPLFIFIFQCGECIANAYMNNVPGLLRVQGPLAPGGVRGRAPFCNPSVNGGSFRKKFCWVHFLLVLL